MIVDLLMDVTPSRHRLAMEVSSVWSRSEAKYESRGGQLCGGEGGVDGKEHVCLVRSTLIIYFFGKSGAIILVDKSQQTINNSKEPNF